LTKFAAEIAAGCAKTEDVRTRKKMTEGLFFDRINGKAGGMTIAGGD